MSRVTCHVSCHHVLCYHVMFHTCHVSCYHVCRWGAPGLRQARSEEVLCPPGQVEQEAANPWHEAEQSTGLTYTLKVDQLDTHI